MTVFDALDEFFAMTEEEAEEETLAESPSDGNLRGWEFWPDKTECTGCGKLTYRTRSFWVGLVNDRKFYIDRCPSCCGRYSRTKILLNP